MKKSLLFYTLVAALGGLIFGFDTAVINGAMPFFTSHFSLDAAMQGWAVSSGLLGSIFGALFAGKLGDIYGRRFMQKTLAVLFFFSALGAGLAGSFLIFVLARIIGGLAIGGASVIAPMYISEIAPAKMRGKLTATFQLAIVLGILTAFFSDYMLVGIGVDNWRWMFLAGTFPAVLYFILLFFVARSPRWLVKVNKDDEALAVIEKVNHGADSRRTLTQIKESISHEADSKGVNIFKQPYFKLILIGVAVGMFNQFTGINIIMYYATNIFRDAGFSNESAIGQTVIIGLTNLVFTIFAMFIIDKVGRRTLLLVGSLGMALFLALFAFASFVNSFGTYFQLIMLIGFIAFFASSQGAVIWVLLAEMFPNSIRGRGTSIGSFSHWFFNAVIAFLFPITVKAFGVGYVFAFYAVTTLISYFFFKKYLHETKEKSLEELEKVMLEKQV